MLAAILGFLPVIGSVTTSITSYLNAKTNLELVKDSNSIEVIQTRALLLASLKDDIGIKLARDAAMWPPIIYVGTYIWDRWVDVSHPNWVWGVRPLDLDWTTCLPIMAVYTFLFALSWRGPRA